MSTEVGADPRFIPGQPASLNFAGIPHTNTYITDSSLTQVEPENAGTYSSNTGKDVINFSFTTGEGTWVDFSQSFITYTIKINLGAVAYAKLSEGAAAPFRELTIGSSGSSAKLEYIQDYNSAEAIMGSCLNGNDIRYGPGAIAENMGSGPISYKNDNTTTTGVNHVKDLYLYPRASGILSNKKLMPLWMFGNLNIALRMDRVKNMYILPNNAVVNSVEITNVRYNLHTVKTSSAFTASFAQTLAALDAQGLGGVLIPYHSVIMQTAALQTTTFQQVTQSFGAARLKSALSVIRRSGDVVNGDRDYLQTYLYSMSMGAANDGLSFPTEYYYNILQKQYPEGEGVILNRNLATIVANDKAPAKARAIGYLEQALSMFQKPLPFGSLIVPETFLAMNSTVAADAPMGISTANEPLTGLKPLIWYDMVGRAADYALTAQTSGFVPKSIYAMNFDKDRTASWFSGVELGSSGNALKITFRFNDVLLAAEGYQVTTLALVDKAFSLGANGNILVF